MAFFKRGGKKINKKQVRLLFEEQLRIQAESYGFRKEQEDSIVRHVSLFGEKGFISFSDVAEEDMASVINRELDYFNQWNQQFEWKVYSYDQPENLRELLVNKGFTCEDREALMVMDMEEHDHLLFRKKNPYLNEITSRKEIREIIELEEYVWKHSLTELGKRLWRDKQNDPDSLFLYGIYENERLVSAAWLYLEQGSSFASLWGGSTLPAYRNRGYYTDLLAARAQKAYEKGFQYLTVDAGEMSYPILEKSGFECLAYSWGCLSPDGHKQKKIKKLDC